MTAESPCPNCQNDQHLCFPHKLAYWRTAGHLNLDPRATPSRRNTVEPSRPDPAWERGIVTDPRPDGSSMPIIEHGTLNPIRVKHYQEKRSAIEAERKRLGS